MPRRRVLRARIVASCRRASPLGIRRVPCRHGRFLHRRRRPHPIGKLSGALAPLTAADLGGIAIEAALERAGVAPDEVDYVFMGQVLLAGQGQITARQAAVKAGIPMRVPATTVNKVCLSGLNAIYLADQMIAAGEADIVVAGGMESMTNAPYLLPGARAGYRYGNTELRRRDHARRPVVRVRRVPMGARHRALHAPASITRERAGRVRRHVARAGRGRHQGRALRRRDRRRSRSRSARATRSSSSTDEGVRPGTTAESLAGLRPAFDKDGTITAGNASADLRRRRAPSS